MDSGASNHMMSDTGTISLFCPPRTSCLSSTIVRKNGSTLPITATVPGPFYLNNVLLAPNIIKNLICVCQFTTDNHCSVEFDLFGLSVKDLCSRSMIMRCSSSGPLYTHHPLHPLRPLAPLLLLPLLPCGIGISAILDMKLSLSFLVVVQLLVLIILLLVKLSAMLVNWAVTFGYLLLLLSRVLKNFDLIHCDLWTSSVASVSATSTIVILVD
jgi:hypothetical protein